METHSSLPKSKYLARIFYEIGEIIQEHISNTTSENYPKKYEIEESIDIFASIFPVFLHKRVGNNEPKSIHESVPCWAQLDAENIPLEYIHTHKKVIQ